MTTPDESVPVEPPVVPEEAAAQDTAADAEAAAAAQLDAIRELATEIAKQAILSYDPATIRKGTITAIATTAAPPTLSVQISGDTTTTIDGVRYIEGYNPVVGDVVQFFKQGTDLVAFGKVAAAFSESAWTLAPLGTGWTHNGNSGGNVMYRKVWDHGSPKMQWKGVAARSGGSAVLSGNLASLYRPAVLRPVPAARTGVGGSNSVKLDFGTDGSVTMVGGATSPTASSASAGAHTHSVDITDNDHTHGIDITDNAHTHNVNDHRHAVNITDNAHTHGGSTTGTAVTINGFTDAETDGETWGVAVTINGTSGGTGVTINGDSGSGGSHTHTVDVTVTDPVWISFNDIEYFLD